MTYGKGMTSLNKLTVGSDKISTVCDHLNTSILPIKRLKIDVGTDRDKTGYLDSSSDSDEDEKGVKTTLSSVLDLEFTKSAKSTMIKGVRKLVIDIHFAQPEDGDEYFKPQQMIAAELEEEMRYGGLSNGSRSKSQDASSSSLSSNERSLSQEAVPDFIKEQIKNDYICLDRCDHSITVHDLRYDNDLVIEFKECSERFS